MGSRTPAAAMISAIGISLTKLKRPRPLTLPQGHLSRGFTLLEMLVVTAVIGLMTAIAVLSFKVVGGTDPAKDAAIQLQQQLLLARDLAELEQRAIGVYVTPTGYEFFGYSGRWGAWRNISGRGLPAQSWPDNLLVQLFIEGRAVKLDVDTNDAQRDESLLTPQFGVAPTGDFTAFELQLRMPASTEAWILRGDPTPVTTQGFSAAPALALDQVKTPL